MKNELLEHIKNNLELAINKMNEKINNHKYNYYKYDNELINQCNIFISVGTRSTGKTTATNRDLCLEDWLKNNNCFIKLCRTKDELKSTYQAHWWTDFIEETLQFYDLAILYKKDTYYINVISLNEENGVLNESKFINTGFEIGKVIPILRENQYKSANYKKYNKIIFDECFLKNENEYRQQEIECFNSFIATVNRTRDDVKVFLIGNIFSNYNPYFEYFGIDITELKSDNVYMYSSSDFENPCKILLEYTKPVFRDTKDVPLLLRTKGNANNIIGTTYEKPNNVIKSTDWIVLALKNNVFLDYYNIFCKLEISVDDSKSFKKNLKLKTYYLILDKTHKDLLYIVAEKTERDGLSIFYDCNMVYKLDYDIRHKKQVLPLEFLKSKKLIYGDFKTAMEFKQILRDL